MKSDKLQDAIGGIREEYIEEAHAAAPAQIQDESVRTSQIGGGTKHRRKVLRTVLPLAACLLLAVGIVSGGLGDLRNILSGAKKSEPMESIGTDQMSVEQESKAQSDPHSFAPQKPGVHTNPQTYGSGISEISEIKEVPVSVFYQQFDKELGLLSPEEALQQLLSGVYFSNPEGLQLTGSESFPEPELKYLSFDGSENYQPFYVFEPENAEVCFGDHESAPDSEGVCQFYVPALLSATPQQ